MDSQVVTIDQFDAATTSIQEVITSLVPQLTPFTLQSQTEVASPRAMMVVPTLEDVYPLYGIEKGIARGLWPKSSLFYSKEKKPLGGQRPGDVGIISSTGLRPPRRYIGQTSGAYYP
ncbi:hypothetical protein CK203_042221 [Vitis vinifera]|uniref:Uncharacterized protein n=1 Tax=Vitis vinifera TaxID=29760 RepID=A0A438HPY1_VITVI|nr:hypothetical protein CK203_042221 [Vitis vinifera]